MDGTELWSCVYCTYLNSDEVKRCDICSKYKPEAAVKHNTRNGNNSHHEVPDLKPKENVKRRGMSRNKKPSEVVDDLPSTSTAAANSQEGDQTRQKPLLFLDTSSDATITDSSTFDSSAETSNSSNSRSRSLKRGKRILSKNRVITDAELNKSCTPVCANVVSMREMVKNENNVIMKTYTKATDNELSKNAANVAVDLDSKLEVSMPTVGAGRRKSQRKVCKSVYRDKQASPAHVETSVMLNEKSCKKSSKKQSVRKKSIKALEKRTIDDISVVEDNLRDLHDETSRDVQDMSTVSGGASQKTPSTSGERRNAALDAAGSSEVVSPLEGRRSSISVLMDESGYTSEDNSEDMTKGKAASVIPPLMTQDMTVANIATPTTDVEDRPVCGVAIRSGGFNDSDNACTSPPASANAHALLKTPFSAVINKAVIEQGDVETPCNTYTVKALGNKQQLLERTVLDQLSADANAGGSGPSSGADDHDWEMTMATQPPPPILPDVVCFVDVRSGHDNRSPAISWVLRTKLGATVLDKFSKDTPVTHVIFRGGSQRTLNMAIKRGLHIVNVLWIDSCINNNCHMNEAPFKVHLDDKNTPVNQRIKKQPRKLRSMQPKSMEEEMADVAKRLERKKKREQNKMPKLLFKETSASPRGSRSRLKDRDVILAPETQELAPTPTPSTAVAVTVGGRGKAAGARTCVGIIHETPGMNGSLVADPARSDKSGVAAAGLVTTNGGMPAGRGTGMGGTVDNESKVKVGLKKHPSFSEFSATPPEVEELKSKIDGIVCHLESSDEEGEGSEAATNHPTPDVTLDTVEDKEPAAPTRHTPTPLTTTDKQRPRQTANNKRRLLSADELEDAPSKLVTPEVVTDRKVNPRYAGRGKRRRVVDSSSSREDNGADNTTAEPLNDTLQALRARPSIADFDLTSISKLRKCAVTTTTGCSKTSGKLNKSAPAVGSSCSGNASSAVVLPNRSGSGGNDAPAAEQAGGEGDMSSSQLTTISECYDETTEVDRDTVARCGRKRKHMRRKTYVEVDRSVTNSTPAAGGKRTLVMTSLHQGERDLVRTICRKLGGFGVEEVVSNRTTHLICGGHRRTLNVLYAVTRGAYILPVEWVLKSLEAGKWLDESHFTGCSHFPPPPDSACKQRDGGACNAAIFSHCGSVYVSEQCAVPCKDLAKLVRLNGGQVVKNVYKADVCIGELSGREKEAAASTDCHLVKGTPDLTRSGVPLRRRGYLIP